MNIPINPQHVRNRNRKYGADTNFMIMPAPRPETMRPETIVVKTISMCRTVRVCEQNAPTHASDVANELARR